MDYSYLISSSEGIDIEYINNKQTIFVSQKNDMKCDKLCFITTVMEDLEQKCGNRINSIPKTSTQDEYVAVKRQDIKLNPDLKLFRQ